VSSPSSTAELAWVRWLCGDQTDRARFLAVYSRFSSLPAYGVSMGSTVLLNAFWFGWPLVVLNGAAILTMVGAISLARRLERAEVVAAVAFGLLQVNLGMSVACSGGGSSALLPLMAVPVFSQAVCFRPSVIRTGVGLSAVLAVAVVLLAPPPQHPVPPVVHLVSYLTLLLCLSTAVRQLVSADLTSRGVAARDPLTGLYNRRGLDDRFLDVRDQAQAAGDPISLVLCDIDRFKTVNDTHGHARGDQVLVAVANELRTCLRGSDDIYRLGGEEFLVLLPGEDASSAALIAERVRRAIGTGPMAGLTVTLSAGVATATGDAVRLERLLREADDALYDAKRSGRNRVSQAWGSTHVRSAQAAPAQAVPLQTDRGAERRPDVSGGSGTADVPR
jgi:diguanylate cyclase (GGDEF)-like protein